MLDAKEKVAGSFESATSGGDGGIRTHVPDQGQNDFEFYPLRSTQWNIVEVIRLYRKIQTIEITLKISSKSERSRLHADLNPLEKSAKNPPKREN